MRPRILAALDRGPSGGVTLLVAPAGFGKTTALAAWAARTPGPVAWLTLSEAEREPFTFLDALVTSVRTIAPEFGDSILAMRRMADLPEVPVISAALAGELADLPDAVTLVLDDCHRLGDSPAQHALTQLVQVLPDDTRLIIATRRQLPLRVARLRAIGRLVEIGPPELRFQPAEISDYLRDALADKLTPAAVEVIVQRTEGWPVAVGLVAQILGEQADPEAWVARFRHEDLPQIREYLLDELLAGQPPTTQALLLRTSIVDQVCAELCDALLGDGAPSGGSQAVLDELDQVQHLLQPLDQLRRWYRVHDAFREALVERARSVLGPERIGDLHRRASAWFAAQELPDAAIEHALVAGDLTEAVRLVERTIVPAVELGDFPSIRRRLERMPAEAVEERPRLLLGQAWVEEFRARYDAAAAILDRFEVLLQRNEEGLGAGELTALRAEASAVLTGVAATLGDGPRLMELARQADEHLPPSFRHARARAGDMIGIAYHYLGDADAGLRFLEARVSEEVDSAALGTLHAFWGMAYIWLHTARPEEACELARRILAVCPADNVFVRAWAHLMHGQASYELDRLAEAREHFLGVDQIGPAAPRGPLHASMLRLAHIEQIEHSVDEAWTTLQAVEALPDVASSGRLLGIVQTAFARLELETGDLAAARSRLQSSGRFPILNGLESLSGAPTLTCARLLAATGDNEDLAEASATLDVLEAAAASANDVLLSIGVRAVRGLVSQARGDLDDALHQVEGAVATAAPGGLVRTFVDLGPPMQALLAELTRRSAVPSAYVARLLAAFPSTSTRPAQALPSPSAAGPGPDAIESLNERESAVLQLLTARLSNREIAASLGISSESVRRHTRAIYRKLMIGTRRAAVDRAHELGLLVPDPPGPAPTRSPRESDRG